MRPVTDTINILSELYKNATGSKPVTIHPIAGSGSQRKYFRVTGPDNSVIATLSENTSENEAFFHIASVFSKAGVAVPEVLYISRDRTAYLQTDLGNVSLLDLVERSWLQGSFHPSLLDFYREALEKLIHIQFKAGQAIRYSRCYPEASFNRKSIREDMNYFRYYFLKMHNIELNESKLNLTFDHFARKLASVDSNSFMYRDFQARNIMVHMGSIYFIDFQGGRRGPALYDLASILYQGKARIPESYRLQLKDYYFDKAGLLDLNKRSTAEEQYYLFVYLRLMQVLGAYGYRGLIQKKSHFIESIPYTLNELNHLLSEHPLKPEFNDLNDILRRAVAVKDQYINPASERNNSLIIRVNSFSYKKSGIPVDESGNGGGFVFDCRSLPNPGRDKRFKSLTGKDKEVKILLGKETEVQRYLAHAHVLVEQTVANYMARNFTDLMISFGCTGGQHRSVFCAEQTALFLKKRFPELKVIVKHPELNELYF